MVLPFESVDEFLKCDSSNETYRTVLLFIIYACKVVVTFELTVIRPKFSVALIYSYRVARSHENGFTKQNENIRAFRSQVSFQSINEILKCVTIQMKAIEQYFPVVLFIFLHKVVLTFESVEETLKFAHSFTK